MTADHHPEELIDRARQGALDPDEQSILDGHFAICAACAAHLAQAPRFEQELAPQPRDEILDRRAVEAVMLRMQRASQSAKAALALSAEGTLGRDGCAWRRPASCWGPLPRRPQSSVARSTRAHPSSRPSLEPPRPPRLFRYRSRSRSPLTCRGPPNRRARRRCRRALFPSGRASRLPRCSSAPASCVARDARRQPSRPIAVCRRLFLTRGRHGCRSRSPVSCCWSEDDRRTRWHSSSDIPRSVGPAETWVKRRSRVARLRSSSYTEPPTRSPRGRACSNAIRARSTPGGRARVWTN